MKIYDAFMFYNELDLLEIRLELLNDYIDYFIISECDHTFSGLKKPFNFEMNKERFSKFLNKIIYIKNYNSGEVDNIINTQVGERYNIFNRILYYFNNIKNTKETDFGKHYWCRDFLHREFLALGMDKCEDDDVIIFGDLDEIPNPEKIKFNDNYLLHQKNMIYFINTENTTEKWYGTFIMKFSEMKNKSLGKLRGDRGIYCKNIIENAGWHLTFMGGSERIKDKIKSYSHQEFNNDNILSQIENKINSNSDILCRNIQIKDINIYDYYPENMINLIKQKYHYLIK